MICWELPCLRLIRRPWPYLRRSLLLMTCWGITVPMPDPAPVAVPPLEPVVEGATAAPPLQEQKVLKVHRKAHIEWKTGPEGEIKSTEEQYRSLASLYEYLFGVIKAYPDKANDYLEIYLQVEIENPGTEEPRLYIAKGTLEQVLVKLGSKCVTANQVVMELQMMLGHISEISTLKGVIMTLVFSDAQAGGLGFLTESNEVTNADIQVLGEAATSQAELFKEKMREGKGVVFPNDKGKIIMPGDRGMPPNLPPNLKFRR